eukprot:gene6458-13050_t
MKLMASTERKKTETNITKFVIFAASRTGSTYLCELLSKHPSVLMNYEIFNAPNNTFRRIVFEDYIPKSIILNRRINPGPFLEKIWNLTGNKSAIGFKIFYNHILDRTGVERLLLLDKDIKKIVLMRSDILRVYVSYIQAKKTKTWSKLDTSNATHTVNITDFNIYKTTYLSWFHMIISKLKLTRQKFSLIEYNNDLNKENVVQTLDHIQHFLGVPQFDSNQMLNGTQLVKQASTPIEKRISNWNDLPEYIRAYSNVNMSLHELISI